jgi:7,8-dihydroneopterin aldolase/epimerase/oxygenase
MMGFSFGFAIGFHPTLNQSYPTSAKLIPRIVTRARMNLRITRAIRTAQRLNVRVKNSRFASRGGRCYAFQMRVTSEQQIHIEQLKVLARVGVPNAERARRQRLVLNITLWPARDLRDIKDAISRTVDYSVLCREAKKFLSGQSPRLLETMANDLAAHLLRKFRIRKVGVEIRKFVLKDAAYASVTVVRHASLD